MLRNKILIHFKINPETGNDQYISTLAILTNQSFVLAASQKSSDSIKVSAQLLEFISRHQPIFHNSKTMKSLYCTCPITALPNSNSTQPHRLITFASSSPNFLVSSLLRIRILKTTQISDTALISHSRLNSQMGHQELEEGDDPDAHVEVLKVPDHWLVPSRALEV